MAADNRAGETATSPGNCASNGGRTLKRAAWPHIFEGQFRVDYGSSARCGGEHYRRCSLSKA